MVNNIRAVDPNAICILELSPFGRLTAAYSNLVPMPFPKIVYSFHFYDSQDLTHQGLPGYPTARTYPGTYPYSKQYMLDIFAWLNNFNATYPGNTLFCGEFSFIRTGGATNGDGSPQRWITDFLAELQARNCNWTYHAFREYEGWDAEVPSGALGSPAARSPTAPTITLLKGALANNTYYPPATNAIVGDRWSDTATWGGPLPTQSTPVDINSGETIILDTLLAEHGGLTVNPGGTLIVDDAVATKIVGPWIFQNGGRILYGSATAGVANNHEITVNGSRASSGVVTKFTIEVNQPDNNPIKRAWASHSTPPSDGETITVFYTSTTTMSVSSSVTGVLPGATAVEVVSAPPPR